MKLYIAGLYAAGFHISEGNLYARLSEIEKERRRAVPWLLESYHYVNKERQMKKLRADKRQVFLDSGAFSAFTQGVVIDIDAYCDFIKKNIDVIKVASVLDGIGDPLKTYQNQVHMEKKGVKPLPCFHYGEDVEYLKFYLKHYEYITIGGMVPIATKPLKIWLDDMWENYLTDENGRPLRKFHGFGLTTLSLMKRYPWYSVDSSSWVQAAANGALFIPRFGSIPVSPNSPATKQFGRHYKTFPIEARNAIVQEVEKDGWDFDRLCTQYLGRWIYNAWAYSSVLADEVTDSWHGDPKFIGDQLGIF